MAIEKILNTRILLKTATLEEWNASTLPLKKGEIAIATVAATAGNGLAEPVCMIKIGEDGVKTFKDLPWNFYAKASDVIAAAKSEDTLRSFINGVIADAGIASDDAMQELAGKVTTAEGKITTLEGKMTAVEGKASANETAIATLNDLVGDKKVATQISEAITALNLGDTYAAKVHGHAIADVENLETRLTEAKKAGTDAATALGEYKTLNDAAVKVNTDAIAAIKKDAIIDTFKAVEEALAGKQAAGDYSVVGHKHEIADVNGLQTAIDNAQKAGTDAAAAATQALTDAKAYTDSEMTRLVGETPVAEQISGAIANYTTTADMNSAIATAKGEAVEHANGLNTAMDARVQVVEGKAHTHTFVESELNKIADGDVAKWNAAEQNAKDYADGLDEVMDGRVAALEAKFGDGEDNVETQIATAVAAEAKLREETDAGLQEQIEANDAEILALQGLVGDKKVSEAIAEAVKAEEDRAKGVEGGLETRLKAVEDDYLVAADKTELEGKITANANAIELLTNGVSAEEVDGVNDLIQYVKDHGTEVTGIKADIKQNADDIDALEGRMNTAEGAIATKAAQADLEALAGRVTTIETEHDAESTGLKARMTQAEADIDALEGLVGDKKVSVAIDEAIEAALKVEVDGVKVDKYALASALADAIARIAQNETDIATKANDADLAAIAKTGSTDDLVQGELVLLFDCGGAN